MEAKAFHPLGLQILRTFWSLWITQQQKPLPTTQRRGLVQVSISSLLMSHHGCHKAHDSQDYSVREAKQTTVGHGVSASQCFKGLNLNWTNLSAQNMVLAPWALSYLKITYLVSIILYFIGSTAQQSILSLEIEPKWKGNIYKGWILHIEPNLHGRVCLSFPNFKQQFECFQATST